MEPDCDVVVAGAGPAGAVSATLLARAGCRVTLLDRAHFPRSKACAEYLSPGVVDALRDVGLGDVLEDMHPFALRGMEIISPRGCRFRVHYQRRGDPLSAGTLLRTRLDEGLVRAASRAGVALREGFVVRAPLTEGETVVGVSGMHRGKEFQVRAALTIVADGARSVLARSLGLAAAPRWPVRLGLVAHYTGQFSLPNGYGQMHVAQDGYCGVAPMGEDLVNVGMVVPAGAPRRSDVSAAGYFDAWIAGHPRLRALLASSARVDRVRGVSPVGARARRASGGGVLLVGDAAGFFDPFTGEGIYRAIRSAEMASHVAVDALAREDFSAASLATYDRMRVDGFRSKEAITSLVQAFVQFPRLMDYALPRLAARPPAAEPLCGALGDVERAAAFLNPRVLWTAFRP